MNLLAINTCTRRVSVAIAIDGEPTAESLVLESALAAGEGSPRHVEELAPAIKRLLRASAITARDIDVVAVTVGPGMFTGLRVGMSTACTFAGALGLPMIALSSLEVLADPLQTADCDAVVPVLDARRAELYFAVYTRGALGFETSAECDIATPGALADVLAARGGRLLLCGDALNRYPNEFAHLPNVAVAASEFSQASCTSLVRVAHSKWQLGSAVEVSQVVPVYLRQSDAEINVAKVSGGTM